MKHLKTYNESIKHLLKPKNKEEILNILRPYPNEYKFRFAIEHNMYDLADKVSNDLNKYFQIPYTIYAKMIEYKKPIKFEDNEIDDILKLIKIDEPNGNCATINDISTNPNTLKKDFSSLIISNGYNLYIINNYKYFITVNMRLKGYYICPRFKDLLKLLDYNMVKCGKIIKK